MKLNYKSVELRLKDTFTISSKSIDSQLNIIVKIEDEGLYGLGEAATSPFYQITESYLMSKLNSVQNLLKDYHFKDPYLFYKHLKVWLPDDPFARCALDVAGWDLYGKKMGVPVYQLIGLKWEHIPLTNFTIGIDSLERMLHKIETTPWPLYKIKLGTDRDIEIIEYLRRHTDALFRVDANCAWTAQQTIENARILMTLGVEFIEQPNQAYDFETSKVVYEESVLPLIADESCQTETDVLKCENAFHGINIKLMKCGGITPALNMISEAKRLGLKVMVGCMTESSVGISAIAQLLPLLDYVDMDGALLLKEDIANGVKIVNGKCLSPELPGNGAELIISF